MKLSLHHKQDDYEQKRPLSRLFAINLKNVRPTFSRQDYPHVIRFNLLHLFPSMLLLPFAVFLLCCSTVLSGYCNVSFYFLGILGIMILHHFALHSPFKVKVENRQFIVVFFCCRSLCLPIVCHYICASLNRLFSFRRQIIYPAS